MAELREASPDSGECYVIDTDAAADDLRAIAILYRHASIAAIVTTEGATQAGVGAAIVRKFFREADVSAPQILVGANTRAGATGIGSSFQVSAAHLDGYYKDILPEPPTLDLRGAVGHALVACHSVTLVVLAPWSSLASYAPIAGLWRVIAQGRPDLGKDGRPVSWNCLYDANSCRGARVVLGSVPIRWVDLPAGDQTAWRPAINNIKGLQTTGLTKVVRAFMLANLGGAGWNGIWDDFVALAVLCPSLSRRVGSHDEPSQQHRLIADAWLSALGSGAASLHY